MSSECKRPPKNEGEDHLPPVPDLELIARIEEQERVAEEEQEQLLRDLQAALSKLLGPDYDK